MVCMSVGMRRCEYVLKSGLLSPFGPCTVILQERCIDKCSAGGDEICLDRAGEWSGQWAIDVL